MWKISIYLNFLCPLLQNLSPRNKTCLQNVSSGTHHVTKHCTQKKTGQALSLQHTNGPSIACAHSMHFQCMPCASLMTGPCKNHAQRKDWRRLWLRVPCFGENVCSGWQSLVMRFVITGIDGHLPSLRCSPNNPRRVTNQRKVYYRLSFWHLDLTHKINARW